MSFKEGWEDFKNQFRTTLVWGPIFLFISIICFFLASLGESAKRVKEVNQCVTYCKYFDSTPKKIDSNPPSCICYPRDSQ